MPAAIATAAGYPEPTAPFAICAAAEGGHAPAKQPVGLPCRHCALCAGFAVGLPPNAPGGLAIHPGTAAAELTAAGPAAFLPLPPDYAAAQPRAPPRPV